MGAAIHLLSNHFIQQNDIHLYYYLKRHGHRTTCPCPEVLQLTFFGICSSGTALSLIITNHLCEGYAQYALQNNNASIEETLGLIYVAKRYNFTRSFNSLYLRYYISFMFIDYCF